MDILIAIIGGGAGAAVVAGAFRLIEWWLNRKAKLEDSEQDQQAAECAARGKELKAVKKSVDALFLATKYLMYDRIRHLCEVYIARQEITPTELEVLTNMHRCYHDDLDGNGFLDALMEQVQHVPIVPEKRRKQA